jgi:4-amino-4-deoxy-L-arabinose transferase-like glycosyltransferase
MLSRVGDRHAVLLLILVTALVRLLLGGTVGLTIDESYMVAAGRILRAGYFDHPPASWWLSRGATLLLGSESPVVVRAPFVALFAISTWLMFRLTARIASERAGLWAAVALNAAPVFGVTTGGFVLPDGPMTCALLGAALCLVNALSGGRPWAWWPGAGACAGLAMT